MGKKTALLTSIFLSISVFGSDFFDLPIEELLKIRIESADFNKENILKTPSVVSVISRNELDRYNIRTLGEVFNLVPGFQAYISDKAGGGVLFSSRGRNKGFSNNEVLILLDGHRLNSDWSGSGFSYEQFINLNNVEYIEFIRGPGSAVYGSNAFLGVVNIVTQKKAKKVALHKGNTLNHALSGNYNYRKNDFKLGISGILEDSKKLARNQYDHLLKKDLLVRETSEHYEVSLNSSYKDYKLKYRKKGVKSRGFYSAGFPPSKESYLLTNSESILFEGKTRITKNIDINFDLFHMKRQFTIAGALSKTLPLYIVGDIREVEVGGRSLVNAKSDFGKMTLGLEYRRPKLVDTTANTSGVSSSALDQAPENKRIIRAGFFQLSKTLSKYDLVFGLRRDEYTGVGKSTNPRLGLIYNIDDQRKIKVNYGESFRAPSRSERDVINSSVYVKNEDLLPEEAKSFDITYMSLTKNMYFSGTLFFTEIDNAIEGSNTTPIKRINGGQEHISGVEVETRNDFKNLFELKNSISWIYDPGIKISPESELFFSSILFKKLGKFNTSLIYKHFGKREFVSSTNKVKNFGAINLIDLSINYSLMNNNHISFKLNNLFDSNFNYPASNASNSVGVKDQGRSFEVGVEVRF